MGRTLLGHQNPLIPFVSAPHAAYSLSMGLRLHPARRGISAAITSWIEDQSGTKLFTIEGMLARLSIEDVELTTDLMPGAVSLHPRGSNERRRSGQ